MNEEIKKYIRGLLSAIENDMLIQDDSGMMWYWSQGRIRCVAAELEFLDGDISEIDQNGYDCKNYEEGIKVLRKNGYITLE